MVSAMAQDREFRDVLALVSRTFKSASADAMRRVGVHVGQNFLLDELWREDRLTAGELARRVGVEQPTITRMSQRMETAGLVTRVRDENDRRVIRIALTEQGQALREQLPAMLDDVARQALDGLTTAQQTQLVGLLSHVAGNMARQERPRSQHDSDERHNGPRRPAHLQ
jgi:DNA-binding MarR family transcriptional regulator